MGKITAEIPTMRKMLLILLPNTLPIAISVEPLIAERKFTVSSGAEVPIATTVKPITKSFIPKRFARAEAPLTNHFALKMINIIPPARYMKSSMV